MIVCHCRAVSDRDVARAVETGARDVEDVARVCDAGTDCRGCHARIDALVDQLVPRVESVLATVGEPAG